MPPRQRKPFGSPTGRLRSASSLTSSRSIRWPKKPAPTTTAWSRTVSVRKEQIRVLLVQAYPNYEFRYLKNMLERDSTIQLNTVLQDADQEYAELDQSALRGFPVRREDLFEYDVLLFGDVNPAYLSIGVMQNIADFVEKKGGGVAFIAGPLYTPLAYRHTPLAELLPVDLETATPPTGDSGGAITEGFRVEPTELGLASPQMQLGTSAEETKQIWANLPKLYWLLETPVLKPAARVLAEHPTLTGADGRKLAVFSLQFVGAGKVLFHATDDTWRLALSRRRRLLLALLDSNDPLSQPLEAVGQGPLGRTDDRPPPISSRRGRRHSRPLRRRAAGASRRRRRDGHGRAGGAQEPARRAAANR